jgi:hypothetical protein
MLYDSGLMQAPCLQAAGVREAGRMGSDFLRIPRLIRQQCEFGFLYPMPMDTRDFFWGNHGISH